MVLEKTKGKGQIKEKIYEYIKDSIQNGILLPGEKVLESPIAETFKVSRTPVREVMTKLNSEGILDKIPHKGFYVRKFSEEERLATFEVISSLDYLCAKKAMDNLTEEDIHRMKETIAKIDVAIEFNNFTDYMINQRKFHDIYFQKCNNRVLVDTIYHVINNSADINASVDQKHYDERSYELLKKGNEGHRMILKAFLEKDYTLLENVITDHWK